jgi:hypothetical protein
MALTAGQRVDLKKRTIEALFDRDGADVGLIFAEFGIPLDESSNVVAERVRRSVYGASEAQLIDLDAYLHPDDPFPREPEMAPLLEDEDNTPFTPAEQERIADVLAAVMRQAADEDVPATELRVLQAKLDYLIEAAKHSRRKEWLIVAVTVISQPFVDGVLTSRLVHTVLTAVAAGLGPIFGHPTPLIGP